MMAQLLKSSGERDERGKHRTEKDAKYAGIREERQKTFEQLRKHFIHISFYVIFDSIGFHLQTFLRFLVLSFVQTISGILLDFVCEMGG